MSLLTCVERRLLHVASGSECCWGEEYRWELWPNGGGLTGASSASHRGGGCCAIYGRLYCSAASRALVMAMRMLLSKVGRLRRALALG